MINAERKYCYRITHVNNLKLLLQSGIVNKNHPMASCNYENIGNPDIIGIRDDFPVKIKDYGYIGEYVPFYFTPKSVMLYNIITGHNDSKVKRRDRTEILIIRCLISDLTKLPKWFFSDGQANTKISEHFNDLNKLDKIDWRIIYSSDFSRTEEDPDKIRRYQAEFLVYKEVPFNFVESLCVYDSNVASRLSEVLIDNGVDLNINIKPNYFFEI